VSRDELAALVRHVLTMVAGVLVSHGWLNAEDGQTLAGAVAAILVVLWSIWQKRRATEALTVTRMHAEAQKAHIDALSQTIRDMRSGVQS
jgi:hypothetical protein